MCWKITIETRPKYEGILGGDGTVLCLDRGDVYMTLCVCQNSQKSIIKVNFTAHKLYLINLTKNEKRERSIVLSAVKRPIRQHVGSIYDIILVGQLTVEAEMVGYF